MSYREGGLGRGRGKEDVQKKKTEGIGGKPMSHKTASPYAGSLKIPSSALASARLSSGGGCRQALLTHPFFPAAELKGWQVRGADYRDMDLETVLLCFSVAMKKTGQKQSGEKRVSPAYTSRSQPIMEGSKAELKARTGAVAIAGLPLTDLLALACSATFLT